MKFKLEGHTAHASQPEMGRSPAATLSTFIRDFFALASGDDAADPEFALVTVTHARLGEPAFGISPGEGELWVTLRTKQDAHMDGLVARAENLVADHAAHAKLDHSISYHDVFQHCENDYEAAEILKNALHAENFSLATIELPMRGSEDFGRFRGCSKSAMFLLGSGLNHPSLHNPDFDSPDELILPGARIFTRTPKMLCYD